MKKNKLEKISEIRVEAVYDNEDRLHFYRVYFYHDNGKIDIMCESSTKTVLVRHVSKIY